MLEVLIIFATSFVVALSGAMMPGPLLALTIVNSARQGFWAGPITILGHGILELMVLVALALGLIRFMDNNLVTSIVGVVGGTVLVTMGLAISRRGWRKVPLMADLSFPVQSSTAVLSGILGSVSNPYWFIWWATIGLTYLLWSLKVGAVGLASFFGGHILADLAWYSLVSFLISRGRKVMSESMHRLLLLGCGLTLLGLGGYFIASGVNFFI